MKLRRAMNEAQLMALFIRWVAEQEPNAAYNAGSPREHPLAAFFGDHGYDEALWLPGPQVVMLTACWKYTLTAGLHHVIQRGPWTYGDLAARLNARQLTREGNTNDGLQWTETCTRPADG